MLSFPAHSTRSWGFTLIEILVVISIIGIASTLVIASLSAQRSLREADRAAHTFAATLREAQNAALAGLSTGLTEENCYYGVRVTSATTYRTIRFYRSGGSCTGEAVLASYTLPNGVRFSGVATSTDYAFLLPRAEVYMGTGSGLSALTTNQRIGFTKSSRTIYICLYPSGRVEARGTTATCP